MLKALVVATAALSLSAAAHAADLPARTAPVFAPPLPVFTWTGGYFGINAGYAFDESTHFRTAYTDSVGVTGAVLDRRSLSDDGFTAGGQIGYNYQFGAGNGIVVGFEADAAYTDLGRTRTLNFTNQAATSAFGSGSLNTTSFVRFHTDMDFLGTVRGRIGYAFDRFMIYGTGGFAYGDVTDRINVTYTTAVPPKVAVFRGGVSNIATGYTYGGGIEFAIAPDSFLQGLNFFRSAGVTLKAEYLHYDLGSETFRQVPTNANGTGFFTTRVTTDGDLARIGINYKF